MMTRGFSRAGAFRAIAISIAALVSSACRNSPDSDSVVFSNIRTQGGMSHICKEMPHIIETFWHEYKEFPLEFEGPTDNADFVDRIAKVPYPSFQKWLDTVAPDRDPSQHRVVCDEWGSPLLFFSGGAAGFSGEIIVPARRFVVVSCGFDGQFGTEDDCLASGKIPI